MARYLLMFAVESDDEELLNKVESEANHLYRIIENAGGNYTMAYDIVEIGKKDLKRFLKSI